MQAAVFRILGLPQEAESKFGFLLRAMRYISPAARVAFGLDRLVMLMAGATSMRDVIASA